MKSCRVQLFFQEALLLNPAFYSFQKPEGVIDLLRAFALKPGKTPSKDLPCYTDGYGQFYG